MCYTNVKGLMKMDTPWDFRDATEKAVVEIKFKHYKKIVFSTKTRRILRATMDKLFSVLTQWQ